MKRCYKATKRLLHTIMPLVAVFLFSSYLIQSTYASNINNSPNVIIMINSDGSVSQNGDLFGHGHLYPATIVDAENGIGGINGIIRIDNKYKTASVDGLGLEIAKDKMVVNNSCPKDIVYNSFLDNINIKIEKGNLLNFDKTLIDYTSLRNLLFETGNLELSGMLLKSDRKFTIYKGKTVDLKYTLHMDENTNEELEAVKANVRVFIHLSGIETPIETEDPDNNEPPKETEQPKSTEPPKETLIPAPIQNESLQYDEIAEDDIPGRSADVMLNDNQMIVGGGGLPKAGETAPIIFYSVGLLFICIGIYLRIRK